MFNVYSEKRKTQVVDDIVINEMALLFLSHLVEEIKQRGRRLEKKGER